MLRSLRVLLSVVILVYSLGKVQQIPIELARFRSFALHAFLQHFFLNLEREHLKMLILLCFIVLVTVDELPSFLSLLIHKSCLCVDVVRPGELVCSYQNLVDKVQFVRVDVVSPHLEDGEHLLLVVSEDLISEVELAILQDLVHIGPFPRRLIQELFEHEVLEPLAVDRGKTFGRLLQYLLAES